MDEAFLERCVMTPEDVGYFFPRGEEAASPGGRCSSATARQSTPSGPVRLYGRL